LTINMRSTALTLFPYTTLFRSLGGFLDRRRRLQRDARRQGARARRAEDAAREGGGARLGRVPGGAVLPGRRRERVLVQRSRAPAVQRNAQGCGGPERHPGSGPRRHLAAAFPRETGMMLAGKVFAAVAAAAAIVAPAVAQDAGLVERGRTVFAHYCAPCHGPGRGDDGAPMLPGTHALHLKYRGAKPALLEERTDLPYDVLKAFVR